MTRPMLLAAGFVALGISAGDELTRGEACLVALLSLAALGLAAAARSTAAAAATAAAALGLGAAAASWERQAYERMPLRAWVAAQSAPRLAQLDTIAARDAVVRDEQLVVLLDVHAARVDGDARDLRGRVRIRVGGEAAFPRITAGDRVTLWAELRAPRPYGNPGALDVEALARQDGIHALGSCKSARLVEVAAGPALPFWRRLPAEARRRAREVLLRHVPEGPERGIAVAMVLGDQSLIDYETAERFRAAGTYHVLALSGAQVALLAGALVLAMRWMGAGPIVSAAALTPALAFYAALVGADTPIVRATVMALAALWGRAWDLDVDLANLLGFAAAVMLLAQPSSLGDIGFALSFAATLGILVLVPKLMIGWPRLPLRLEWSLAASIASQVTLTPILAARLHRIAPAAVLLNIVAVPLSGFVLLAGLATLALALVWATAAGAAGWMTWGAAHLLIRTCDAVAWIPALDVRTPGSAPFALFLYIGGLLALLVGPARRPAWVLLLAGFWGLQFPPAPADGRLHLTVLDVGQGDALVLRLPSGRVWAIDTGGAPGGFDVGESVVAPYLWAVRASRLDGLVVTHAHVDHVGGAPFLVRQFAPREVWEGPAPSRDPMYRTFAAAAAGSTGRRRTVTRGMSVEIDGVRIEVLGPVPPDGVVPRTRNDDSVVLRVSFGRIGLLLAGDIESAGEQALGASADVLKVPHHGSRTSSSAPFLSRLGPRVAILSVGARNRFGHPHPDVLRRYMERGIRVYRTDRDGAVTVSTDGEGLWVSAFRSGSVERMRR